MFFNADKGFSFHSVARTHADQKNFPCFDWLTFEYCDLLVRPKTARSGVEYNSTRNNRWLGRFDHGAIWKTNVSFFFINCTYSKIV